MKKRLIICKSTHHGNTAKIAEKIAAVLKAEIKNPENIDPTQIPKYDLIGFGSGIYNGKHHPSLFDLVSKLELTKPQKAFIFQPLQ